MKRNSKEDFLKYVKLPENLHDCWEWIGHANDRGYGYFKFNNKECRAHRFSFELFIGEIPEGLCVCHSCDNRKCVNPTHLYLGTVQDNVDDRNNKDRQAKGENHGKHKLTKQDIIQIYGFIEDGYSNSSIANIFDVSVRAIRSVRCGETWSWVKQEMYQNEQE